MRGDYILCRYVVDTRDGIRYLSTYCKYVYRVRSITYSHMGRGVDFPVVSLQPGERCRVGKTHNDDDII